MKGDPTVKLIHTTVLNELQKKEILSLTDACKKAEPITLSAPLEDGLDYLLLYEEPASRDEASAPEDHSPARAEPAGPSGGRLAGFGFLFFVPQDEAGSVTCEFTAFVRPEQRQKGCFSRLLDAALTLTDTYEQENGCQTDFCFLTDEKSPAAKAVLEKLEAEYWYSEYKMVREPREADRHYQPHLQITEEKNEEPAGGARLFAARLDGRIIGTCALLPSASEIYLFAFQIAEPYQSQGHGKDFLRGMLALTEDAGLPVTVQVSGLNYIARNLYKKTGFRTAESLSYYLY